MSILVPQNTNAPLTVSNFYSSAYETPATFCFFLKIAGTVPGSGSYGASVIRAQEQNAPIDDFLNVSIGSISGTENVTSIASASGSSAGPRLSGGWLNNWKPAVAVFASAASRTLYSLDGVGATISDSNTFTRAASGVLDLRLFADSWAYGDVFVSHITLYQAALTQAQAEEYMVTGEVAGLTPYAKWDATSDWGAGDIIDAGSSGTNLTPPAAWTFSADNPTIAATGPDYTNRKGSSLDNVAHGLGTLTTATLNGVNVFDHVSSQAAGTVSFAGAITDEIATSGEYDLGLGDGVGTETYTVQVNVYGVAPSNNPLQKDGSALASLTDVQVRVTAGSDLNGTQLEYLPAATTDASGNLGNIDLSSTAAADTDPVLLHMRTSAGDSIIADETVGLI